MGAGVSLDYSVLLLNKELHQADFQRKSPLGPTPGNSDYYNIRGGQPVPSASPDLGAFPECRPSVLTQLQVLSIDIAWSNLLHNIPLGIP